MEATVRMFVNGFAHRMHSLLLDESGQEIAEFALILSVFSIVAITGFAILATITSTTVTTQQSSLSNSALNPM
jgi:Flp pilus assembly pilin Flp